MLTSPTPECSSCQHGQSNSAHSHHIYLEILVLECFSVDRKAAITVAKHKISALDHEVFLDPVEGTFLVALARFLPGGELGKVLRGSGDNLAKQTDPYPARLLAVNTQVKEHLLVRKYYTLFLK